jgi:ABC-type spermidine/putrescine transport system permease subunit II
VVKRFRSMTYPYIAWIIAIIVVPMILIVLYAFTTSGNSVLTFQFTFENFARFVTDKVFMDVLLRSLYIALITTLICVALGYPIAYVIAQRGGRRNTILILLITMPTWVNMLVRTYAWMGILQDEGIFNSILSWFGIGPVSMIHTSFAVILGMVYNFIPFMILQIHTSLAKMDKSLLEAANDLGATPVQAFLRAAALAPWRDLRHHARILARGVELLYPEAPRRRTVCPRRQHHRNTVPHHRRLELRFCHLAHHGGHHHDLHVAHAQGRCSGRLAGKGVRRA